MSGQTPRANTAGYSASIRSNSDIGADTCFGTDTGTRGLAPAGAVCQRGAQTSRAGAVGDGAGIGTSLDIVTVVGVCIGK